MDPALGRIENFELIFRGSLKENFGSIYWLRHDGCIRFLRDGQIVGASLIVQDLLKVLRLSLQFGQLPGSSGIHDFRSDWLAVRRRGGQSARIEERSAGCGG